MSTLTSARKSESGQAMVELALVLPFVLLIALSFVDFGMMMHSYILVTQAAREAARSASFGDVDATVRIAAEDAAVSLVTDRLSVTVTPPLPRTRGSKVSVTVTYIYNTFTPGLRQVFPTITLAGRVAMRVE